jgi:hypothetical protein
MAGKVVPMRESVGSTVPTIDVPQRVSGHADSRSGSRRPGSHTNSRISARLGQPTTNSQAPTRHCARTRRHTRKQKARICGPFVVGGTGLEPVTPSLSTRFPALQPLPSFSLYCRGRRLVSPFWGRDCLEVVNGRNALYRTFRHCTGTGTVASTDKEDQFVSPHSLYELVAVLRKPSARQSPARDLLYARAWKLRRRTQVFAARSWPPGERTLAHAAALSIGRAISPE